MPRARDPAELYESIAPTYDRTRRADPRIAAELLQCLALRPGRACVDIACGTGNYTIALRERGLCMVGVDSSPEMLAEARAKAPNVAWHLADAAQLPFRDGSQDGATCVLAIHHMADRLDEALGDAWRVLAPGGGLCIFTADPAQIRCYWLRRYFPDMVERSAEGMPPVADLARRLARIGFRDVDTLPYRVPEDPVDLFLYAGKHRPDLYLDAGVRAGISSFARADPRELHAGLERLARDVTLGRAPAPDAGDGGDYVFLVARKPD